MKKFLNFRTRAAWLKLFEQSVMSKNDEKVYYAVGRGKEIGIYDTWKECKSQTEGIPNAKFRKFFSLEEAEEFVKFWKNYSPVAKESNESLNSVSRNCGENTVSKERECQILNKKLQNSATNKVGFSQKNIFILGLQTNESEYCTKPTLCVTPYISPMPPLSPSQFIKPGRKNKKHFKHSSVPLKPRNSYKKRNKFQKSDPRFISLSHSIKVSGVKQLKVQNENLSLQSHSKVSTNSSQECSTSVDSCPVTLNTSTNYSGESSSSKSFITSVQKNLENSNSANENNLRNFDVEVSENPVIKKEVFEIDSNNLNDSTKEGSQNEKETSEFINKLIRSLKMLESASTVVKNKSDDEAKTLKNCLKILIEKIFTITNTNVKLQIEPSESIDKICENSKNCDKTQFTGVEPSSAQDACGALPLNQQQQHRETESGTQMSQIYLQSPSPHSTSFEGRIEHRNVDVLALNLRLDSFEKRFDACLKEVGAIASEISHIKAEIKEMKETLCSEPRKSLASGSSYSPRKAKDGMLQTTLPFNADAPKKSKSYSTYQETSNPQDTSTKREKKLKRKLSRSDSHDSSKRFANDEEDYADLLSRIKTETIDYASFIVDDDEFVEVYTDGASHCNGKDDAKAGIGVWWGDGHPLNVAEPVVGPPTNNTAEIQAARVAIELALKSGLKRLKIFTDSEFLINCATRWIHRWKKNGWVLVNGGPVKNRKELEKLDKVSSKITVRWEKVAGHAGITGNEMADRLANEGAAKYKR